MRMKMYTIITAQYRDINEINGASKVGGGKLFVTEISAAMRIRTGQRGEDAH